MDKHQLTTILRQYRRAVRAKCRRLLRDAAEADDVAQDAFERLLTSGPKQEAPRVVLAYLYRIATNRAIDRLRKTALASTLAPEALEALVPDAHAQVCARDLIRQIWATLDDEQLRMLVLVRIDRLTQVEVAEVMDLGSDREVRRRLAAIDERLDALRRDDDD